MTWIFIIGWLSSVLLYGARTRLIHDIKHGVYPELIKTFLKEEPFGKTWTTPLCSLTPLCMFNELDQILAALYTICDKGSSCVFNEPAAVHTFSCPLAETASTFTPYWRNTLKMISSCSEPLQCSFTWYSGIFLIVDKKFAWKLTLKIVTGQSINKCNV